LGSANSILSRLKLCSSPRVYVFAAVAVAVGSVFIDISLLLSPCPGVATAQVSHLRLTRNKGRRQIEKVGHMKKIGHTRVQLGHYNDYVYKRKHSSLNVYIFE
jgi:hypothetical protein